jgi:hypothetical protein
MHIYLHLCIGIKKEHHIYIYKAVMLYNGGFCKGRVTKRSIKFNNALLNMRVTVYT